MDGPTISRIIEASKALELSDQPWFIAIASIKAARATDEAISDQALEAEFRAWWKINAPVADPEPDRLDTSIGMAWARHLLSRGRYA